MAFELFKLYGSIFVDNKAANSAIDETATKSEDLQRKFGEFSGKAKTAEKAFGTIGSSLTKYVTAPLTAVGGLAVSAFNEVDDGMDIVIQKTGATGKTAENLESIYRNLGKTMPDSFDNIGSAVGEVNTRFGYTGEQLQNCSEEFLKFARVNGTDVTESVRLVSRVMGDASIPADQYTQVMDSLTSASQKSGITIETLTTDLSKYGAPMRALGFDTQSSISIFSQWEKTGVNTEIAFSGMKKAISNWSSQGKDARVEFGKTLQEIQAAPDIASATTMAIEVFGQKAGPDLADAIQTGKFSYEDFMSAIGDSSGTLDATYSEMIDGGDRIKTAWNNIKISGTDLGETILNVIAPMFEKVASAVSTAGQWFSSLSPQMQQFIVVLGMIAAAAGPVFLGVSKISGKLGEFATFMSKGTGSLHSFLLKVFELKGGLITLTGPAVAVIAAVAGLAAVLIGAYQNSEQFRTALTEAWSNISEYAQLCFNKIQVALAPVIQTFKNLWVEVQPVLQQIGDMLATYVVPILEKVVAFVLSSFTNIITGIAPLIQAAGNILSVIVNLVGMVVSLLNGDWSSAMQFGQQALKSLWDACVNVWNGIWVTISALLSIIQAGIALAWNAIVSTTQTLLQNIWTAFSSGFQNLWTSVSGWAQNVVTNIWNALKNLLQTGSDALNNLASGISSGFSSLWTNATTWAQSVVTNIGSGLAGLWQMGSDAIGNLWSGMLSGFEELKTNISTWCGNVVQWFKDALGIASPSTVFQDIAHWVKEGFFKGLNADEWWSFASSIMDKVVEAFKSGGLNLSKLLSNLGSGALSTLSGLGFDLGSLFGGSGAVAGTGSLQWPSDTSTITSWFGYRDDVGSVGSSYHQGLDIGAPYGSPIYAASSGTVEVADWYGGYGNAVKLSNGNGMETLYGHMSSIAVSSGQSVAAGQVIGYVGSTGNSTGPHLHFSVLMNGEQVDPSQFFALAEGGIATRHIISHIGDGNEPEAVVPLSKSKSFGFGVDEDVLAEKIAAAVEKAIAKLPIGLTMYNDMSGQLLSESETTKKIIKALDDAGIITS